MLFRLSAVGGVLIYGSLVLAQDSELSNAISQLQQAQQAAQKVVQSGAVDVLEKHVSAYLRGRWKITKRMCVRAVTTEAIKTPSQVFDLSNYNAYSAYDGNQQRGNVENADKKGGGCLTNVEAVHAVVPTDIQIPRSDLKITEVVVSEVTKRQRQNCHESYQGPRIATVTDVIRVDENKAYFLLLPGQLQGTPVACENKNDFNLDEVTRITDDEGADISTKFEGVPVL